MAEAKPDDQDELYKIPDRVSANAHIKGMHNYLTTWEASVEKTEEFWGREARERLSWFSEPKTVLRGVHPLPGGVRKPGWVTDILTFVG